MADEGAGATLTFGTSGVSLDLVSIQSAGWERTAIRTFHHGTTGGHKTYKPGDFAEPGTVNISWLYDPAVQPPTGAAETITIASPIPAGSTAADTEAFTGWVQSWDGPSMEIDSEMVATAVLKKSGPSTYST